MKRVQINSKSSTVNVSLKFPQADASKEYQIYIEKLIIPNMPSLNLNQALFTIERRLAAGVNYTFSNAMNIQLPENERTFAPIHCRNVVEFISQLSDFIRRFQQKAATIDILQGANAHFFTQVIPAVFTQDIGDDWVDIDISELKVLYRSDGRVGIQFSMNALPLFVFHLTDAGKRIFGFTQDFVALDDLGSFTSSYLDLGQVAIGLPALTEGYTVFSNHAIFNQLEYRHDISVLTSLPFQNIIDINNDKSSIRRILASYKFPNTNISIRQTNLDRDIEESMVSMYIFEDSISTHNNFILKGSVLQNFHLYLVNRRFVHDNDGNYKMKEEPYDVGEDSFFTIQLAVRQIK